MPTVFKNPYTDSVIWSLQGGLIMLQQQADQNGQSNDYIAYSVGGQDILAATEEIMISQERNVQVRMPLVGDTSIKIISPPTGKCRLTSIIGPQHVVDNFLKIFGDACYPFTCYVHSVARANQICDRDFTGQKLIMRGCTGQAMSFQMSVRDNIAIAQGQFEFIFDTLQWQSVDNTGSDSETAEILQVEMDMDKNWPE